ncbi:MAG: phosphocarrier protein HPr [Opitutae bacterium]|jgi:phosphocarrier protein|nr:phosphocarrier protein HPr [Opitutae bacterium]|tara:strand:- start:11146 stop:11445 length:300 start_codon:yes stop_codon:yes gene_type:complete
MGDTKQTDEDSIRSEDLVVANEMGVHARPAAMVVRITNKYEGEIWVEKDGERVNGKSIMGIMMLAAGAGSKLTVYTDSPQADELFEELRNLFAGKFQDN